MDPGKRGSAVFNTNFWRYISIFIILSAAVMCFCGKAAFATDTVSSAKASSDGNSAGGFRRSVKVGLPDTDTISGTGEDNRTVAFTKDYFLAVAEYAGWDCDFVAEPWDKCIEGVRDGSLDTILDVSKTDERMAYFDYASEPMGNETCYMYGRSDTKLSYDDFSEFNGITVGFEGGSTIISDFSDYAVKMGFTFREKSYVSGAAMFAALDAGEVDAVVQTNMYDTPRGHVILAKCDTSPVYIVTTKKKPELKPELDEAMSQLLSYSPGFNADIFEYHFKGASSEVSGYTKQEKAYLAKKPVVNVYYETSWEPFEYEKDGRAVGITPDIIRAIGEDTGIQFRFMLAPSTKDIFEKSSLVTEDTVMALSYDYSWAAKHGMRITQPYVHGAVIRVMRSRNAVPRTVAVANSGYLANEVKKAYPGLKPVEFLTFAECMKALKNGKADCVYLNYYQASYYRSMSDYEQFSYVPTADITQDISLGVTDASDPALFGILSKSLQRISAGTAQSIINENSMHEEKASFSRLIVNYPIQSVLIICVLCIITGALIVTAVSSDNRKRQNTMLEEAKDEAELANMAKSEFLSRMSHDMRTPLNGIMGMTYIANEQENPARTADCLRKIDTSSKFLLGLINDVLDMTKMESGRLELHPEPYMLEDFRNYIDAVIRPLCEQKHQTFEFITDAAQDITPVTDILRMNQIYFNLLSNASKYTADGGKITVKVSGEVIDEKTERVTTRIRDNGIGMSEEFQKILFEPFTQENHCDQAEMHGSGLGLAIVKRIIEAMGGSISVYSRLGEGTEFTFVIDQMYTHTSALAAEQKDTGNDSMSGMLSGKRILLCEDNILNQEIAVAMLKARGMDTDCAEDGKKGTEMFRDSAEGCYSAILMDIHMPVMNGYEATELIRSMPRNDAENIPIIAMTADAFSDDVKKCMDVGMNGHISKPVEPKKLYQELYEKLHS